MSSTLTSLSLRNPFSTRFVRPGAIPYQFRAGISAELLIDQWRSQNWRGAIIGPHGSGKSTLLATIRQHVEQSGTRVYSISLHDEQRNLSREFLQQLGARPFSPSPLQPFTPSLAIIDGYEQLSWWSRWRIVRLCARKKFGLLITAHADKAASGLPILLRTKPELANIQNLIENWLPTHGGLISPADIAAAFDFNSGNARETLFSLYDLFELRRRDI